MGKLLKDRGSPKKEGFCRKGGDAVSLNIFSSRGVANVTTVTFNYVIHSVPISNECRFQSLFLLHSLVSIIQLLVPVTSYILPVCIMQVLQTEHVVLIYS